MNYIEKAIGTLNGKVIFVIVDENLSTLKSKIDSFKEIHPNFITFAD